MPFNILESMKSETTIASFYEVDADQSLVTSAKRGDAQAFDALVRHHRPKILALALRYARVREDAEDIVQQTLQKAFVYLGKFQGKSRFSTWLTRIAVNEALMLLRKKRASPEISIVETAPVGEADPMLDFPDSGLSPEDNYLQEEQKRILSTAMRQLNPRLREAVELRELGELSTQETARALGLSLAAVKGRLFHARRKLRKSLRRYVGSAGTLREPLHELSARQRQATAERQICNACG